MNGFRIALIGLFFDPAVGSADGNLRHLLHFIQGWSGYVLCGLLLLVLMWMFARMNGEKSLGSAIAVPEPKLPPREKKHGEGSAGPLYASLISLVLTGFVVQALAGRVELVPDRESFARFPTNLSGWLAKEGRMETPFALTSAADDYLLVDFHRSGEGVVNIQVAYYETKQEGEMPVSRHICGSAEGEAVTEIARAEVALGPATPPFTVNRALFQTDGHRQLVYCWFDLRGRRAANDLTVKWYRLWDALVKNRSDGALVRLATSVEPGADAGAAEKRLDGFLRAFQPELSRFIPE
jgi:EpsI family protein